MQRAFDNCFRIRFDEGDDDWMMRFPIPGYTMNALALADQSLSHLLNNPQEVQDDHESICTLGSLANHFITKSNNKEQQSPAQVILP